MVQRDLAWNSSGGGDSVVRSTGVPAYERVYPPLSRGRCFAMACRSIVRWDDRRRDWRSISSDQASISTPPAARVGNFWRYAFSQFSQTMPPWWTPPTIWCRLDYSGTDRVCDGDDFDGEIGRCIPRSVGLVFGSGAACFSQRRWCDIPACVGSLHSADSVLGRRSLLLRIGPRYGVVAAFS